MEMLDLNEKAEQFLDFWRDSRTVDRAGHMFQAWSSAVAELAAAKAETVGFLVPVKSGKSLIPGFDPDRLEEVAALHAGIEELKGAITAIEADIETFVNVTGRPTVGQLATQVRTLDNRLQYSENEVREIVRAQTSLHPSLLPMEITRLPEVTEAHAAHERLKTEIEKEKAVLQGRIAEATKIFAKYIK